MQDDKTSTDELGHSQSSSTVIPSALVSDTLQSTNVDATSFIELTTHEESLTNPVEGISLLRKRQ